MKVTWQSFGRSNLDKETMRFWFDKLISYDFETVSNSFDYWLKNQDELPSISEILKLCKPKVTIYARVASPLASASNKEHVGEVLAYIENNIKPQSDYKAWARKIINNPKITNILTIRYAKEALNAREIV